MKRKELKIQTTYHGVVLKGRITGASDKYIAVELDSPCKGKSGINFGFASAMANHYVFNDKGNISKAGMDGAKEALTWAYNKAETKRVEKKFKITKKRSSEPGYDDFIEGVMFAEEWYKGRVKK